MSCYGDYYDILLYRTHIVFIPCIKGAPVTRHHSYYMPQGTEKSVSDDEDVESVHSKDSEYDSRSGRTRGRYKQRDARRSKSEVRPSDLRQAEDEYNNKKSGETNNNKGLTLSLAPQNTVSIDNQVSRD